METKRLWFLVALIGGCGHTGSTRVQIDMAPGGPTTYQLRACDGTVLGTARVMGGEALRQNGENVMRGRLTIENESDKPLILPANELFLTADSPVELQALNDDEVPGNIVVPPHQTSDLRLRFVLHQNIDSVKTMRLHWVVLADGVPAGGEATSLVALEGTRIYPTRDGRTGIRTAGR